MVRGYDSSARVAAARETRYRILLAARDLIIAEGYPAASMTAIAASADVSPQTIYNSIGNKAAVLKACYDVTLAGDDEPVPMSARPTFQALQSAATPEEWTRQYARWAREIGDRVGDLLHAVTAPGGAADTGVSQFIAVIEDERRIGSSHAVASFADRFGLPAGLTEQRAIDIVWTLNSPEIHSRLVHRCGWAPAAYQEWLESQLLASLT